jgi:hypothetical protein
MAITRHRRRNNPARWVSQGWKPTQ